MSREEVRLSTPSEVHGELVDLLTTLRKGAGLFPGRTAQLPRLLVLLDCTDVVAHNMILEGLQLMPESFHTDVLYNALGLKGANMGDLKFRREWFRDNYVAREPKHPHPVTQRKYEDEAFAQLAAILLQESRTRDRISRLEHHIVVDEDWRIMAVTRNVVTLDAYGDERLEQKPYVNTAEHYWPSVPICLAQAPKDTAVEKLRFTIAFPTENQVVFFSHSESLTDIIFRSDFTGMLNPHPEADMPFLLRNEGVGFYAVEVSDIAPGRYYAVSWIPNAVMGKND